MTETMTGCPVSHHDYRVARPIFTHFELLDAEREQSAFVWNDGADQPFWMVTRYDDVLEAMQMPEVFSSEISNALSPKRPVKFQPNNLNAPEHTRLRKVLNRWFSPAAVRHIEPLVIRRSVELIEGLRPAGECDLIADFALRYPTDMFLAMLGLPVEDGEQFVQWVDTVFSNLYMGPDAAAAMESIKQYFDAAISDRVARPRDPEWDFLSRMLRPDIAGDWLTREDLITVCLSLMVAGLDTTRSALGYAFQHLATHPDDRAKLTADAALIPRMVEELVRLYSLILQGGRLVTCDIDFHGLPMKAGDIVWLGVASANRDPRKFDHPDEFDPDRDDLNHHLGFGAGPHRCLGMHLARHELLIALREWHARIPEYRLAPDTVLIERGAQLSLSTLPLQWVPPTSTTEPHDAVKETS
jgi:cytochrome P450